MAIFCDRVEQSARSVYPGPMAHTPIIINTLGQWADDFRVWVFCCNRAVELDLPALAERHGRDMPIDTFRERLRCRFCGRRNPEIRIGARHTGPR